MKSITITDLGDKNVYIYGAGVYGSIIYKILFKYGIDVKSFIDSNAKMIGTFCGREVVLPEEIPMIENRVVLIASLNHMQEMVDKLESLEVKEVYAIDQILEAANNSNVFDEYEKEIIEKKDRYKAKYDSLHSMSVVIPNIDLVVTEYCNLNCAGCGSLMPLYSNPEHILLEDIIIPFERYLASIDVLLELRILGGETFLYPDLSKLIKHFILNQKIKRIVLFTNATIMPPNDIVSLISDEKVNVHVSDYGEPSKAIKELIALFNNNDVTYYVHSYQKWRDMGNLDFRNYDFNALSKMFLSCDNKNCPSFYRGKVYVCPRAAHGERLGYFKNKEDEVIDFNVEKSTDEYRKRIVEMTKKTDYIACNYCSGNNIYNNVIPAAQQMKRKKL